MAWIDECVFEELLLLIVGEILDIHFAVSGGIIRVYVEPHGVMDGLPNGVDKVVRMKLIGGHAMREVGVIERGVGIICMRHTVVPEELDRGGIA